MSVEEKEFREFLVPYEWQVKGEPVTERGDVLVIEKAALDRANKQIIDLKEEVREYKWEWEQCCERWRGQNEDLQEANEKIRDLSHELKMAMPKVKRLEEKIRELERAIKVAGGDMAALVEAITYVHKETGNSVLSQALKTHREKYGSE